MVRPRIQQPPSNSGEECCRWLGVRCYTQTGGFADDSVRAPEEDVGVPRRCDVHAQSQSETAWSDWFRRAGS